MTHINTGGPAYPVTFEGGKNNGETPFFNEGMTLRDWFAGQALTGITAGYWANPQMGGLSPHAMADEAYQHADAMIAARKGGAA